MQRRLLWGAGIACFAVAAWVVWLRTDGTGEGVGVPLDPPNPSRSEVAPPPVPVHAARPTPSTAAANDRLALPDGTFVPCLNGTTGAPPLSQHWGNRPWSPIVATERSDLGVDWYVHADGTKTTTEMKWRPDLGRFDAMTRIAVPAAGQATPAVTR